MPIKGCIPGRIHEETGGKEQQIQSLKVSWILVIPWGIIKPMSWNCENLIQIRSASKVGPTNVKMENQHEPMILLTGKKQCNLRLRVQCPSKGRKGHCSLYYFDHSRVLCWVLSTGKLQALTKRDVYWHKRDDKRFRSHIYVFWGPGEDEVCVALKETAWKPCKRFHLAIWGRGQKEGHFDYLNIFYS